jgi:putative ABC transport system permease protein
VPYFRHAWRTLRHSKWYSLTVAFILGLACAVTATVFAIVLGVFMPLPYKQTSQLSFVGLASARTSDVINTISPDELSAWRAAMPRASFAATGTPRGLGNLGVVNGPTVWSMPVDASFFDVLGLHPAIGGFSPGDFAADAGVLPAVISHGLWRRMFGSDRNIVGRDVSFGAQPVRVVGVLPPHFVYPARFARTYPEILVPLVDYPANHASRSLNVIVRVPADMTPEAARDQLTGIAKAATSGIDSAILSPFGETIGRAERQMFRIALAAVAALLLLAAVNVAGLSASRGLDCLRESALRRALGASSATLVRSVAAETVLLAAAGTALGLAAAGPLLVYTSRLLPENVLLLREPVIDWRVVALMLLTSSLVAGIVTILSLRGTRTVELGALIGRGAGLASPRAGTLGRRLLVASQVALGLMLMLGASLLAGSLRRVWQEDPGLPVDRTVHLEVRPSAPRTEIVAATRNLVDALSKTPGVESAAALDAPFLARAQRGSAFAAPGRERGADLTEMVGVTAGLFRVMNLSALEGRVLSDAEINAAAPLVVVTKQVAASYWPGATAVGQTLSSRSGVVTVVGVVKDIRLMALDREPTGSIFFPHGLGNLASWPTFIVRTSEHGGASLDTFVAAVKRVDPAADIRRARSIEDALAETIRLRRFQAFLFAGTGGAGLVLVGAGVLGLIAMSTTRRTREVGIRMALGATPILIVKQLLREQSVAVALGLIVGAVVSAWAVRALQGYLYGVTVYDGVAWLTATSVIIATAALGTLLPSVKASRVNPVQALRVE